VERIFGEGENQVNALQLTTTADLAGELAKPVGLAPSELAPGFYPGYPESNYHRRELGVASTTAIKLALKSAAHYKAWVDGASDEDDAEPAPALSLGKAIHMALLEPARFAEQYVIAPDFGPLRAGADTGVTTEQGRENKARKAAWTTEHKGATILDSKSGAATLGMVRSVAAHPLARTLLTDGLPELTLRWDDPETRLICKARADFYRRDIGVAIDVKSTTDARPHAFRRSVESYGYYLQSEHYRSGFETLGEPLSHFVFIAVEKAAPHGVRIYTLGEPSRDAGRSRVRRAMKTLAEACASRVFESYPETIEPLDLSPWALKENS
jgi:hypothetical protein